MRTLWENINGEMIWMDKEMGYTEYERLNASRNDEVYSHNCNCNNGHELSAGRIAVGVAGGVIAAKAAPRVGNWLLWMAGILTLIMIFM